MIGKRACIVDNSIKRGVSCVLDRVGTQLRYEALDKVIAIFKIARLERYLDLMASDKKTEQGKLRFILLNAIGQGAIASDIEPGQLVATLEAADRLCE